MSVIILVLCVMVLATVVHEAGHFVATLAKRGRIVRVQLGHGPILSEWDRAGVAYALALLPLGGKIDIEGVRKGTSQAVVAVSGAVANVVAAVLLLLVGSLVLGVGQMPGGDGISSPVAYAVDHVGAWIWLIPRAVGAELGLTTGPTLSPGLLVALARDVSVSGVIYLAAGISTLWGVLNLIPVPVLRTDGWQLIQALLPRRPA